MELEYIFAGIIILVAFIYIYRKMVSRTLKADMKAEMKAELQEHVNRLSGFLCTKFLVKSCPSCYESNMQLVSISPNARSIEYECLSCRKKMRAVASSPDSNKVLDLESYIHEKVYEYNKKFSDEHLTVTYSFSAPVSPLPYEQTTREPITEDIRSEVWRRDNGQCVKCGSKNNLEFDHIIPVSKGGATSVKNIQLLCKTCNLQKGAKI